MTKPQAIKRLEKLGFKMGITDCPHYGVKDPEPFSFAPHHVLSKPFRQVFIGGPTEGYQTGGFYITSRIRFRARNYRCRTPYDAEIRSIFGGGKTLKEAVISFELCYRSNMERA